MKALEHGDSATPAASAGGALLQLPEAIRRVLVVGAGRSGLAAAAAICSLGREVILSDEKPLEELTGVRQLAQTGVRFFSGPQLDVQLDGIDLVIKSPGVPGEVPLIVAARERGLSIWSEAELAFALLRNPFDAVTGTNGKTTTTALLGHMFEVAGRPVRIVGNIGTAVTSVAAELRGDEELVVELSSFQLEDVHSFRPAAGVFLNLTPDHLDRHGNMKRYLECKARLFEKQGPNESAVLNLDDPAVRDLGFSLRARADGPQVFFFSVEGQAGADAFLRDGWLHYLGHRLLAREELPLPGLHSVENSLAAGTAALARGLHPGDVARALRTFAGVAHRLQGAGEIQGVAYVNDSKATNVEATLKALAAYPAGVHLILGGRDKDLDYRPVARACASGCRGVYLIGEAASLIERAFEEVRVEERLVQVPEPRMCGDLEAAIRAAKAFALPGEVVLLAPACASLDQYHNFEERGESFVAIVRALVDENR